MREQKRTNGKEQAKRAKQLQLKLSQMSQTTTIRNPKKTTKVRWKKPKPPRSGGRSPIPRRNLNGVSGTRPCPGSRRILRKMQDTTRESQPLQWGGHGRYKKRKETTQEGTVKTSERGAGLSPDKTKSTRVNSKGFTETPGELWYHVKPKPSGEGRGYEWGRMLGAETRHMPVDSFRIKPR